MVMTFKHHNLKLVLSFVVSIEYSNYIVLTFNFSINISSFLILQDASNSLCYCADNTISRVELDKLQI